MRSNRQSAQQPGHKRRLAFEPLESRQMLSLTHWYTFNSGTGEDLAGQADLSLMNGATVAATGKAVLSNQNVSSGDSANVQYLNLPTSALPSSGPLTIEAWYTTTAPDVWTRVFDFGSQNGSNGDSYLFFTPRSGGGESKLSFSPGGGAGNEQAAFTGSTSDGQQHMVAAVVDSPTNTLRLYIDGVQVATDSLAGLDLSDITKNVAYIGRSLYNNDDGFTGTIDEIRIYDEARTAGQITTAYGEGPVPAPDPYPENPTVFPRQVEDLDRGIVAMRTGGSSVYVGWRMLGTDPQDVAFNLYRATTGSGGGGFAPLAPGAAPPANAVKLNATPLTESTNFTDNGAAAGTEYQYFVRAVVNGVEQAASEVFVLAADTPVQQHLDIPLVIPPGGVTPDSESYTYSANDASVGDLDGDGQYEVILKWDPSNAKDNSHSGYTGNVYVDAYSLTPDESGNHLLWRIDLGHNIRAGAHYTQMAVYDFDGDGRSEIIMKTAPGTMDGQGNAVLMPGDSATADYRNSGGYILTGPEYLTVFDGLTGAELDTIAFEPERGHVSEWGDGYGNRVDRFTVGVAYLDGQRPSAVFGRGYYGPQGGYQSRNEVAAYDYRDGELTVRWVFEAATNGANSNYIGQGAHSLTIGDVDGDGYDEVVYGASVIDHDGAGLYSTGLGHGDALHMSDLVPDNPGLEVFMPHEGAGGNGNVGLSVRDAQTGEIIYSVYGAGDVGRGVAADIDPNHEGYEFWATTSEPGENRKIYNAQGQPIYDTGNVFYNFAVWWDGDLTRELLDGTTIAKWNPGRSNIVWYGASGINDNAPGGASNDVASNNGTKNTPALSADILGDWREEVIWRTADSSALQIWSSAIPTNHRLPTLMHDTQYRVAVAWQNGGYNQPPHPSYWIGEGMDPAPTPPLYFGGGLAGDYNGDDRVDAVDFAVWREAMATGNLAADGNRSGDVDQGDYDVWLNNYGALTPQPAPGPASQTVSAAHAIAAAASAPAPQWDAALLTQGDPGVAGAQDDDLTRSAPTAAPAYDSALLLLLADQDGQALADAENPTPDDEPTRHADEEHHATGGPLEVVWDEL